MEENDSFRPYAAISNVKAVIDRARQRNMPEVIDRDFLLLAGVPDGAVGRVIQALRFLNVIAEDGEPTDTLKAIAGAPENDVKSLLATAVRDAYSTDFQSIDPGQDTQHQINDWFQRYQPRSQTARMVMLFLSLCREADIPVRDKPSERKQRRPSERAPRKTEPRRTGRSSNARKNDTSNDTTVSGQLFAFTEDDVAALSEDEFNEIWAALGKVARARAKSRATAGGPEPTSAEQSAAEDVPDES